MIILEHHTLYEPARDTVNGVDYWWIWLQPGECPTQVLRPPVGGRTAGIRAGRFRLVYGFE